MIWLILVIIFVVWLAFKLIELTLGAAGMLLGGWDNLLLLVVVILAVYGVVKLIQRER